MLPHGFEVGDIVYYKGEEWGLPHGNYFGQIVEDPRQSEHHVWAIWKREPSETPPEVFEEQYGGVWGGRGFMPKDHRLHVWSKVKKDYRIDQEPMEEEEVL